jgi:Tfp pilus assembly PilM family ATPase
MAFGWSKTRYSPIAVDFGTDSIKMIQAVLGEPPQIIAAASMEVPPEARTDPSVRQPFLFEAVARMVREQSFKGRRAIISLPACQTLIQHFQITIHENENFDGQVAMNLRQRLNVDPTRMVIRNFPVAQVVREGGAKQEIICMAAGRDTVMNHIEIAHRAKLDVVGMHCEPLAILKSFGHVTTTGESANSATCFLDLGAATTKVVIAHQQEMTFAKTIHVGGDHFTTHLARELGVSFAEARQMRIDQVSQAKAGAPTATVKSAEPQVAGVGAGVAMEPTPTAPAGSAGSLAMIQARMDAERRTQDMPGPAPVADSQGDTLECLIDEIGLCLRHHQNVFPDHRVEKLVFLGGESRHVDLCQKIARALHTGAQLGDPLARAVRLTQGKATRGVDLGQPQPGWAVPMGLCLSQPNL